MLLSFVAKNIKKIFIVVIIAPYILVLQVMLNEKRIKNDLKFIGNITDQQKVINDLWEEILTVSEDQLLVKKETLIKTIQYMIQEIDEEDPKLISFVKSLITEPADHSKLNLINKNKTDFSQIGQSKYMDSLLESKRNGFFIEAGGYDGESHSNTLFFELERDWTGILIEPIPRNYQRLISKNRKIYTINACIADNKPIVAKFRVFDVLSGRMSEMSHQHQQRIDKEGTSGNTKIDTIAYIPCFSLRTILKAINVDRIDYFSLDVEGGEWSILKNFNLNVTNIKSFSIECTENDKKVLIKNFLEKYDYKFLKDDGQDMYFIKN